MKVSIILALILIITSVLGATKVSTDSLIFFWISRSSAIAVGLFIGLTYIVPYFQQLKNTKFYILGVIVAMIFSVFLLIMIDSIDTSLVSNRSYGLIVGSGIIIFIISAILSIASRLTSRLIRSFHSQDN